MDQGAQWATVHGVAKCWTWLKQLGTHMHLMRFSLQSQIFKTPSWPQPNILNRALYSASHDFPDGPAVKTLQVFPGGPVIKTALPVQGSWVWCLFGELRSHMLHGTAKKIILSHVLTFSQTNCGVAFSLILQNTALFLSSEPLKLLSRVWLFVIPGIVAYQATPSMEFSRQEHWSGLPFLSPGDLPDLGSNPGLSHCRQTLYRLSYQGSPTSSQLTEIFP